jgi:hypothetical protein
VAKKGKGYFRKDTETGEARILGNGVDFEGEIGFESLQLRRPPTEK